MSNNVIEVSGGCVGCLLMVLFWIVALVAQLGALWLIVWGAAKIVKSVMGW